MIFSIFTLVEVSLLLMTPSLGFAWVLVPSSNLPARKTPFSLPRQHVFHRVNVKPTTATFTTATSAALIATETKRDDLLFDTLLSWFQGDFDNYRQVVTDRQAGLLPKEGGGHEHIHCTLIPVTHTSRLAAFYFDGYPMAVFRFRYYRLEAVEDEHAVDTVLYTLSSDLEGKLRACADPLQWPKIFSEHIEQAAGARGVVLTEDLSEDAVNSACVQLLPMCEVRWSWKRDLIQHAYAAGFRNDGIHAIMVHGEALVDSQMMPRLKILIKDQLSLWHDQLWIHDRGFDPLNGKFIYGNQRGIPYRMQRVASIEHPLRRRVTDTELAWTMGLDYHSTPHEYKQKMDAIGGTSRPLRK